MPKIKNLVILGGGPFAREVYDLAIYCHGKDKNFRVKGFISEKESKIEKKGYPKVLDTISNYQIKAGDVFFCGVGRVDIRKKCVNMIIAKGGVFINLIHPSAVISPSVKLGTGVGVKAFCVLASDVEISDYAFLQSSVVIGHDVKIGKYSQINSFSFFAGKTIIKDEVFIGAHSKFLQGVVVEEFSSVGIGSLVIKKVPKNTKVFGPPAKELK